MAGIRSIGWWIPEGRRDTRQIAHDYGLAEDAVAKFGLKSHVVAGPDDHPSTMGARATRAALDAAGLTTGDLDLLILATISKDWPAPWVGAFGVLHELGSPPAAGFDMLTRCAGGIDALWIAKTLVEAGTYRNVAVCCAERLDYMFGPPRRPELVWDAAFSSGAATAIVSAGAGNDIIAFSSLTNPDLSLHKAMCPIAGGSRRPLDESAIQEGLHQIRMQLSIRDVSNFASYAADADRHNYKSLFKQTGFDSFDFVSCSPMDPGPQLAVLAELGIDPAATLFTLPLLGHIGFADLLLILGVAIASGRQLGRRIALSTRTLVYSNALAILGTGDGPGIAIAGEGIDIGLWRRHD